VFVFKPEVKYRETDVTADVDILLGHLVEIGTKEMGINC
jgi:hypothetical protein